MTATRGRLKLPVNGEEIAVSRVPHLLCPRCGESVLRADDARQLFHRAQEAYRHKHRLLAPHEIRDLREHLGLTPGRLARLLHLRADALLRWETARGVQSATMDALLRVLRDVPGTVDYLRSRAA